MHDQDWSRRGSTSGSSSRGHPPPTSRPPTPPNTRRPPSPVTIAAAGRREHEAEPPGVSRTESRNETDQSECCQQQGTPNAAPIMGRIFSRLLVGAADSADASQHETDQLYGAPGLGQVGGMIPADADEPRGGEEEESCAEKEEQNHLWIRSRRRSWSRSAVPISSTKCTNASARLLAI